MLIFQARKDVRENGEGDEEDVKDAVSEKNGVLVRGLTSTDKATCLVCGSLVPIADT